MSVNVSAHRKDGKSREQIRTEIREFRMKYLAQEMDLNEDQKQKFFELYNEMWDKRFDCYKEVQTLEQGLKKNEGATESDYQAVTDAMNKARVEDAAIEKQYDEKFAQFLTPKQIYKMKEAENEFRKKMSEMRHKKERGK